MKGNYKYLIYALLIIFVLYVGGKFQLFYKEYSAMYYKPGPYIVFTVFFPILVGVFLGLPQIVSAIRSKKQWSYDWVRIAQMGIPFLIITLSPLITLFDVPIFFRRFAYEFFASGFTVSSIAGLIFGYLSIDCLKAK